MNTSFSIAIELLSPVNVRSADELAQLDPSEVEGVWVVYGSPRSDADNSPPGLKLSFDHRSYQLMDLVEFARKVQPAGTRVNLSYHGRSEEFRLQ